MTVIDATPDAAGAGAPSSAKPTWLRSNWGLVLALAALIVVIWLPTPEGLSIAGQRMLAILVEGLVQCFSRLGITFLSSLVLVNLAKSMTFSTTRG